MNLVLGPRRSRGKPGATRQEGKKESKQKHNKNMGFHLFPSISAKRLVGTSWMETLCVLYKAGGTGKTGTEILLRYVGGSKSE